MMSSTLAMLCRNNSVDEADDEDCASFLMTLKYRVISGKDLLFNTIAGAAEREPSQTGTASKKRCLSAPHEFCTESVKNATKMSAIKMTMHDFTSFHGAQEQSKHYTEHDYDYFSSFSGRSLPLSLPDDKYWLSDVQCYIREQCTEVFSATEFDVASPKKSGRSRPIDIGQVGIRCVFCRDLPYSRRASQAVSFPSQIGGMYSAVVMMQCRHFATCCEIPEEVRDKIAALKQNRNAVALSPSTPQAYGGGSSGRQQYWVESAKKIGLIDTPRGIRFQQDPCHQDVDSRNEHSSRAYQCSRRNTSISSIASDDIPPEPCAASYASSSSSLSSPSPMTVSEEISTPLIVPEDKQLVPDYLYLAIAQMMPCELNEHDRVGCYKGRQIGFPGMACKHCGGLPGFGKYFPASVRSLAQTTTSQTILKHVATKCKRCPPGVRAALLQMQERANNTSRGSKPKYGSRKVFFQRLWGRLHNEHVPEIDHLQDERTENADDDMSSIGDNSISSDDYNVETTSVSHYVEDDSDCHSSSSWGADGSESRKRRKRKAAKELSRHNNCYN